MSASWPHHPLKRILDVVAASGLLVILFPLMALLALLCLLTQGRPVFFRQERPGKNGRIFTLWKFRTMRSTGETDDQRTTGYGRVLRRLGLDELPELCNILRGDMSFVGPRPLLPEYLPRYSPEQARRHDVRPGLTGWAQVHGRNAVDWERKFELDVRYVDHATPFLDARILLLTVSHLLRSSEGAVIPEPFHGKD